MWHTPERGYRIQDLGVKGLGADVEGTRSEPPIPPPCDTHLRVVYRVWCLVQGLEFRVRVWGLKSRVQEASCLARPHVTHTCFTCICTMQGLGVEVGRLGLRVPRHTLFPAVHRRSSCPHMTHTCLRYSIVITLSVLRMEMRDWQHAPM